MIPLKEALILAVSGYFIGIYYAFLVRTISEIGFKHFHRTLIDTFTFSFMFLTMPIWVPIKITGRKHMKDHIDDIIQETIKYNKSLHGSISQETIDKIRYDISVTRYKEIKKYIFKQSRKTVIDNWNEYKNEYFALVKKNTSFSPIELFTIELSEIGILSDKKYAETIKDYSVFA